MATQESEVAERGRDGSVVVSGHSYSDFRTGS